jgi:hypothetical protein
MTAASAPIAGASAIDNSFPTHRILGAIGMLAAPTVLSFAFTPPARQDLAANALMLMYLTGWACSLLGLRGFMTGRRARAMVALQVAGLCLAMCQQFQDQTGRRPLGDGFYLASDIAWPVSHLFMIVLFVVVSRSRVLTAWRRFTPLGPALTLALTLAAMATRATDPGRIFGFGMMLSFFLFGLAVFTTKQEN